MTEKDINVKGQCKYFNGGTCNNEEEFNGMVPTEISGRYCYNECSYNKAKRGIMTEELRDIGIDLIDEHFPKGKCKERGQAIILYALLLIEFDKWHKQALIDEIAKLLEWAIANSGYCDEEYLTARLEEINGR